MTDHEPDVPASSPALHRAVGAVRTARDVVVATGSEAAGYLQGQLSQDVATLEVGGSAWSFVLQPQGKVVAWLRVSRPSDDTFLLDTDAGWGDALLTRLQRFKLRTRVDFELATWACVALRGSGARELADGADTTALHVMVVADAGWPGADGVDLLGPNVALPPGAPEATLADYEALRVECGVPAMGAEATEATIPAELGVWLVDASVSFTKGCYTGQELVARIDSRGSQVPRPVRGIVFDGDAVPEVGAVLTVARSDGADASTEAREVGQVTSAATSAALGRPVALAVVGRAVTVGTEVVASWDGGRAAGRVAELPLTPSVAAP